MNRILLMVASVCLALSACGGDNDSPSAGSAAGGTSSAGAASGASSASGATGASGTGTTTGSDDVNASSVKPVYQALTPASDGDITAFTALLGTQGVAGYRYIGDKTFADDGVKRAIFVNDNDGVWYKYDLPSMHMSTDYLNFAASDQARFNLVLGLWDYEYFQGIFIGMIGYQLMFEQRSTQSGFTSNTGSPGVVSNAAGFLALANGGSSLFTTSAGFDRPPEFVYTGDRSKTTYVYETFPLPASAADFIAQANTEGAKGYRAIGARVFGSDQVLLYAKATLATQTVAPTFDYTTLPAQTSSSDFIAQSGQLGQQGYGYMGDFTSSGGNTAIYYRANNCTGVICYSALPLTLTPFVPVTGYGIN